MNELIEQSATLGRDSQQLLFSIMEGIIPILRDREHFQHENSKHQRLYFETADRLNAALNRLANRDFETERLREHVNALEAKLKEVLSDLAKFQATANVAAGKAEEILARHASPLVAIGGRNAQSI